MLYFRMMYESFSSVKAMQLNQAGKIKEHECKPRREIDNTVELASLHKSSRN